MQLGGAPAEQLGRVEVGADELAGRVVGRLVLGRAPAGRRRRRGQRVVVPAPRHARSKKRPRASRVKRQASPSFGTKPCRMPSVRLALAPAGTRARRPRAARASKRRLLGEEAADLEVRVIPGVDAAEQLEDQPVAEEHRRVALLRPRDGAPADPRRRPAARGAAGGGDAVDPRARPGSRRRLPNGVEQRLRSRGRSGVVEHPAARPRSLAHASGRPPPRGSLRTCSAASPGGEGQGQHVGLRLALGVARPPGRGRGRRLASGPPGSARSTMRHRLDRRALPPNQRRLRQDSGRSASGRWRPRRLSSSDSQPPGPGSTGASPRRGSGVRRGRSAAAPRARTSRSRGAPA